MENVVRQKCLKCVEWTVLTPLSPTTLVSETFSLMEKKFRLELSLGKRMNDGTFDCYPSYLFFQSYEELQSSIVVLAHLACTSAFPLFSQARNIISIQQSLRTNIWKSAETTKLLDSYLTFQVIIFSDSSKECQPSAAAACNASEGSNKIHLEALSRDFLKLMDIGSNFDVEISCEGKRFQAHKIVLETRSTVFSAMLKSDMVEGKTGSVKVEDIAASTFESFLRYLYSGTLPEFSIDTAKQYYEASDKYAVEELKAACSEFLTKNLSEGNACEILVLADQHGDENFRNDVIAYIVDKKILRRDKHWSNFCKEHPILALEVQNLYIQKHCPE